MHVAQLSDNLSAITTLGEAPFATDQIAAALSILVSMMKITKMNERIKGTLSIKCRRCGDDGIAEKHVCDTYLSILHVPVIPLGRDTEWKCSSCGTDPTSKIGVSKGLLAFLVLLLIPICGGIWYLAFTERDGTTFKYVVGPVITIFTVVLAFVCYTHDGSHTEMLDLELENRERKHSD